MSEHRTIHVRGAREHNLANLEVRIPRERLVVVTGPSGSGKSSLAFDTIYAEGQRRYVESLSTYARQFLERLPKPDVDTIEGLSPALSVRQHRPSRNPRSTVGTVTEAHDFLRLLFARVGQPHCPECGQPLRGWTVQQMVGHLLEQPEGARFSILAPLERGTRGDLAEPLARLRRDGFVRVRLDGELVDLGDDVRVDARRRHDLDVYVDRLSVKAEARQRITEAFELALQLSGGQVLVQWRDGGEERMGERPVCWDHGIELPALTPATFSFNDPAGACSECDGLGTVRRFDPERVVPDPTLSIQGGAIAPWGKPGGAYHRRRVGELADRLGAELDTPWGQLPAPTRAAVLEGDDTLEGVLPSLARRAREYARRKHEQGAGEAETFEYLEQELGQFATRERCPRCDGRRLSREVLAVTVAGHDIASLSAMPVGCVREALAQLDLAPAHVPVAERIVREIDLRLGFLLDVGLDYLSLDRSAATLSGGEAERIRLATQMGAGLTGVLYVLDEPSIGLHPRDVGRLVSTLERLRDGGNTVLVVEHDRDVIAAADWIVDMGPGAGEQGGRVLAEGTPGDIASAPGSVTGPFLAGERPGDVPERRRSPQGWLEIAHARTHNLRDIDVRLPAGVLTCVTGVSGSGKSSLIMDTLLPAARRLLHRSHEPAPPADVGGLDVFERVIAVDQSPIGRTPRSSPASYTGLLQPLRSHFAQLPEARARGYGAGRFSFNVKGGRCEACQGQGVARVEMHFLPDVWVRCEQCDGRRYNPETLEVKWRGLDIAQVLEMPVDEAFPLFEAVPAIRDRLRALRDVGLGYLALGRSATTLSGGEAQRVRLARELSRRPAGHALYVLDEPTTGLHFADVRVLVPVLQRLVEAGHTVVIIEHDPDVVCLADHVVDLGPEGGEGGGRVVAEGTPEQVAAVDGSYTGRALRPALGFGN